MSDTISASVLKVVGVVGDSVAFGWGGSTEMFAAAPHLKPDNSTLWKGIFVFTNKQGWPVDSPNAGPQVHPTWTISDGAWLEMTTAYVDSPLQTHPHDSPYEYPNVVGCPIPTWEYEAAVLSLGTGVMVGFDIPLLWHLGGYIGEQVGLVKVAVPGAYALRYDAGGSHAIWLGHDVYGSTSPDARPYSAVSPEVVSYNWWTPADRYDFDPSSGRLYSTFIDKCTAAKDALPSTTTMDMDTVVVCFGNNDAALDTPRIANWSDFVRTWVNRIRADLVLEANVFSLQPAHQIKIIWIGVQEGFSTPNSDEMNSAAVAIADEDPWMTFIDIDDVETHTDDGHPNHNGYLELGPQIFDAIRDMDVDPYDAMEGAVRLTVAEVMAKIRLKYSRSKSNTDTDDDVLLEAMNEGMFNILGDLGDHAYWLKRRHTMTLSGGGYGNPITLPKKVHELMEIESLNDATYPINFEEIARVDGGRLMIVMPEHSAGTYTVHYLRNPTDLTTAAEKVPIPQRYLHWWICEVCALLAAASSNPIQRAAFESQAAKASRSAQAKASATTRGKRTRLYTQRRLPDPMRRRRSRRWDSP